MSDLVLDTYSSRKNLSLQMQPIAIEKIYRRLWPGANIIHEVDLGENQLEQAMDQVGNSDKVIFTHQAMFLLAQRIRQGRVWEKGYRDFTIREAEERRINNAYEMGGAIPNYYSYGYATSTLDDFIRLYILRFPEWWVYSHDPSTPKHHRLKFMDLRGKQENFWYISWHNIPPRYFAANYILGIPQEISPLEKRNIKILIQQPQLSFDM